MFVRWKTRQGKKGITYSAYLVYSVRSGSRTRQKVLEYLGCITHRTYGEWREWEYRYRGRRWNEEAWQAFISRMEAVLQRNLDGYELVAAYRQISKVVPEKFQHLQSVAIP